MTIRSVPYPASTKAKGWRFELDLELVIQSDTWDLAAEIPMAQPALMMMWAMAWLQVPCGSMPADPELVRAKVKVPPKLWGPMRDVLLRGWWLAEDGRLYHDTITARVLEMLGAKESARTRKAEYRAKQDAARRAEQSHIRPELSHGTYAGHDGDGRGKDATGTGTGTSNTTPTTIARDPADTTVVFAMHPDWTPGPSFEVQAKLAGLPVKDAEFMASGTREFVGYWLTQAQESRTQAEWEHQLAKSLKREQARAAAAPRPAAGRRPSSHAGFDAKDYNAGVNADGTLA